MFPKVLTIIIAIGCISLALLAMRQQRLVTVHEMTQLHRELMQQRRSLWTTRQRIAEACRTGHLRELLARDPKIWMTISRPWTVVSTAGMDEIDHE